MNNFTDEKQGSIRFVAGVCFVAALGGLLFGYDTGVINGSLKFVQLKFDLSPAMKGFAASSALLACIFGAAFAGALSDRLGRKKVLIISAILFLISAIGTSLPQTLTQFILFRIIGGLGVGAASMTSPMYIAEISPARIRGRMVSLNQFAIISGMLVVYFVNYFVGAHGVGLNHVDVTAYLDKTTLSVPEDRVNEVTTTKDAMAKQLLNQIANYKVKVDPKAVEVISNEFEKQLPDQGILMGKPVPGVLSAYVKNSDEWKYSEIADNVAAELSQYGV
ncbi:MAG: MFS transporter, partial [Phycisphaerae bacterium]|nr:MFS transporter [Phycisphaerae bacterium]